MTSPSTGARYLLERRGGSSGASSGGSSGGASSGGASAALYDGEISTPEACFRAEATLHDDGAVELVDVGPAAPAELRAQLLMFARLTARGAPARRAEGLAEWPQRVQRWRPRK
ncbi:MAG: hypothetical protein IPI49_15290 [Myxococcales bacterium]|nr:hypothetical protein [Myxococcales bacterium]